jgi:hypothetical protein
MIAKKNRRRLEILAMEQSRAMKMKMTFLRREKLARKSLRLKEAS